MRSHVNIFYSVILGFAADSHEMRSEESWDDADAAHHCQRYRLLGLTEVRLDHVSPSPRNRLSVGRSEQNQRQLISE
jgi:hypothetical protein